MTTVTDHAARSRFELVYNGALGFSNYQVTGEQLTIPSVEAAPVLRGTGSAGRLMEGVVEHARNRGLRLSLFAVTQCFSFDVIPNTNLLLHDGLRPHLTSPRFSRIYPARCAG